MKYKLMAFLGPILGMACAWFGAWITRDWHYTDWRMMPFIATASMIGTGCVAMTICGLVRWTDDDDDDE